MADFSLTQLRPGQSGRVCRIETSGMPPAGRQRLQEMGLVRGAPVQFVRVAPLGDPIEIKVRGCHLSLRRQEADAVIIEVEDAA